MSNLLASQIETPSTLNLQSTVESLPNVSIPQTAFNSSTLYFASSSGQVESIQGDAPINVENIDGNYTVSLSNSAVTAGTYSVAQVTVDEKGIIQNISSGTIPPLESWSSYAAASDVNMSNNKLINLAAPVANSDGANKQYVDNKAALYLPLSGGSVTGNILMNNNTVTNLDEPVNNSDAATKQYVDSQIVANKGVESVTAKDNSVVVAGTAENPTIGLPVQTVVAGQYNTVTVNDKGIVVAAENTPQNNLLPLNNTWTGTNAFNGSDFTVGTSAAPISDTFEIHAKDVNLRSHGALDVLNITSAAAVVVAAGAAVNMSGATSASLYSGLGTVAIGTGPSPLNHIIVNGADITDVDNLSASGDVGASRFIASTQVTAPQINLGNVDNFDSLVTGSNGIIGLNNNVTPSVSSALLDTNYNKPTLNFVGATKTLSLNAKNSLGAAVELSSTDFSTGFSEYVPLAGNLTTPMTGPLVVSESTNIESKNITTALITPLPSVGFVSVMGPTQVEGGNFLVSNNAGSEIGLAASASPPVGEVATISYSFATDDIVHINKPVDAPSVDALNTLTVDGINVKDLITFKDARTFYVSKQGLDSNSGSILEPFLTVQAAVNAALTSGQESVIDIGAGVFNENITIGSTSGLILQGVIQNDRCIEGTTIKGLITVNITGAHNLNNNQVIISGVCINGKISDVSTKDHTLIVQSCRIEADNAIDEKAIEVNITANDGRTYIQDCVITQEAGSSGTNPLISCNVGFLYLVRCDLTVRSLASVVSVSGSGAITNMSYCGINSTSSSSSPNALITIGSSIAKTHNIGFTTFVYASSTVKLDAPAIRFISASQTCVLGNNGFNLTGTSGNSISFDVGCNPILVVSNNRAITGTANSVQAGAIISVNTYVGENVVQSVSAGSGISVSGGTGATPSISNTGVLELTAGTNITITGTKSNYTINASGGSGGVSSLNTKTGALSILAGTGITVDNTVADEITINSTAVVESIVEGNGITVDSTDAANPIVSINATGTIETSVIDVNGTGENYSTFGVYPRVGGSYIPPTQPLELAPVQYVDDKPIGVASFNTLVDDVVLSAGTNISLDTVGNTITINNTAPAGVSSVSGTAPIVSSGGTTPAISLSASGVVANTYAYPSSLTTDTFGRITAITGGTNPSGTFLPLAGGTMSGSINMGAQQITNAGSVTTTGVIAGALSLPNASVGGVSQVGITALQTDTNGLASNNLYITQTSGALSLFKPLANPCFLYNAGASSALYTYLVPQFYGERHVFLSTNLTANSLFYNTNANYTVGGNSISLNPFYVELTNGGSSALTVRVRYPAVVGGGAYPPVSTLPTTTPPLGNWTDQNITGIAGAISTTPTLASGATKRLFYNGTSWFLI
jgi:hypothetical protein